MKTLTAAVLLLSFLVGAEDGLPALRAQAPTGGTGVGVGKAGKRPLPGGKEKNPQSPGPGATPKAPVPAKPVSADSAPRAMSTGRATAAAGASGDRSGTQRARLPASTPGRLDGATQDLWWRWWELSRLPLLLPEVAAIAQPSLPDMPRTSAGAPTVSAEDAETARRSVQPLLAMAMQDDDPQVRAAAATAAGRIGGDAAVSQLRELLSDKVQRVRESALLALGASGASQAAPCLLDLASADPSGRSSRVSQLSPDAPSLAWVALGLGRQRGFSPGVGQLLVDLSGELPADRLTVLIPATLLYQRLSPADDFDRQGLQRLDDSRAPLDVRARSAEALGTLADPLALPRLHAALREGELPLQRSAALALASFRSAPLLSDLVTQLRSGQDELLRGYLLLAVANQEPAPAAAALTASLCKGDALLRPWSALSLGLLARRDDSVRAGIATTLREEAAQSGAVSDRIALLLASGLARDEQRVPEFLDLLANDGDSRTRQAAAQALALVGLPDLRAWESGPKVRLALNARLDRENDPATRGVLAESLAMHQDARDVPALLAALAGLHAGEPIADLARGCGAQRTRAMLAGLMDMVSDPSLDAPVQGATWESLGLLLDSHGRSRLPQAMAGAELDALPDWCDRLLAESTL